MQEELVNQTVAARTWIVAQKVMKHARLDTAVLESAQRLFQHVAMGNASLERHA